MNSAAVFVLLSLLAAPAYAAPETCNGSARYAGAAGDVIVLDITLDNGMHIVLRKDPMELVNHTALALSSPANDGPPGARLEDCGLKPKACEPVSGAVVIDALTADHVSGHVAPWGHGPAGGYDFTARIAQRQNPLLTGGLETAGNAAPKPRLVQIHFDIRTRVTGTMTVSNAK